MSSLRYNLHSGKNAKWVYYMKGYLRQCIPACINRLAGQRLLRVAQQRSDYPYIQQRIQYYCAINQSVNLPASATTLGEWHMPKKQKVYYLDSQEYTRYFSPSLRWMIVPGDIIHVPEFPAMVKSRPLCPDNANGVLFKMDKVRHFIFVNDNKAFKDKLPMAIFRGKVAGKPERRLFMQLYFGNSICNCGDVSRSQEIPAEWQTPKMSIQEHLCYRYIISLEGNDVASNLKWIMSSHSIAVMPRPTCETWFMEGTLIPNYHYIEIKSDFSDLEERLNYYNAHLDEAEAILHHANDYVQQFMDVKRERLILIGVMNKYLHLCN